MTRAAAAALLLLAACAQPEIRYPKGGEPDRSCARPAPRQLFTRALPQVRSVRFRRLSRFEARETVRLSGNVLLRVRHAGCARVGQVYRFLLPTLEQPAGERFYWYRRAAALLRQAAHGAQDRAGLTALAEALERRAGDAPPYDDWFEAGSYQKLSLRARAVKGGRRTELTLRYAFAY